MKKKANKSRGIQLDVFLFCAGNEPNASLLALGDCRDNHREIREAEAFAQCVASGWKWL
jgi:hypothetical protein